MVGGIANVVPKEIVQLVLGSVQFVVVGGIGSNSTLNQSVPSLNVINHVWRVVQVADSKSRLGASSSGRRDLRQDRRGRRSSRLRGSTTRSNGSLGGICDVGAVRISKVFILGIARE